MATPGHKSLHAFSQGRVTQQHFKVFMFLKNLIVVVDCVFWFVLFGFFFDDFLFTFMSSPIFDREHVRSLERSFLYHFLDLMSG